MVPATKSRCAARAGCRPVALTAGDAVGR
jgi:hypothetical protein